MRLFSLFFTVFFTAAIAAAEPARVLDMRLLVTPEHMAQLIFDLSEPVKYTLFNLNKEDGKPHRVVLDIQDADLVGDLAKPDNPLLLQVRGADRDGSNLRIVLDVKNPVSSKAFLLKPAGRYGHRLVLTLQDPAKTRTGFTIEPLPALAAMPVLPALPVLPPALQVKPKVPATTKTRAAYVPPPPTYQAQPVSRPLPVVQTQPLPRRHQPPAVKTAQSLARPPIGIPYNGRAVTVAIDAGHGGLDPGASGPQGTREKDVVLAISRELAKLIAREPGMRAVLIRDGDYFLSLRERIKQARQYQADIFISIHADAYEAGPPLSGASVYMLSQKGASSEAAKWLAERENGADLLGGVSLSDKSNVLASILLDLSQTGTLEASTDLGGHILRKLGTSVPLHHSKMQRAAFMVLRSPDIPSVLVETAFISNPSEEKKLNSGSWRKTFAQSLLQGIRAYFSQHAPPGTLLARQ